MSHPLYDDAPRRESHPLSDPPPKPKPPRGTIVLAERDAVLTLILVVVNVALFILMSLQEPTRCQVVSRFRWIEAPLFCAGALFPTEVFAEGALYRLVTAMFLHGSLPHLVFNMFALYYLGSDVERTFGRWRFLVLYLLGGLGGSVLSAGIGDYDVASVGASGAIFAIWGAQALHAYRHRALMGDFARQILQNSAFFLLANLAIGFMPGSRIDNWGHIGGLLGGLALAWLVGPRYQLRIVGTPEEGRVRMQAIDAQPFHLGEQTTLARLGFYTFGLLLILFIGWVGYGLSLF
ncbi:MAG: rhomboid family intramembrane serine protease [Anaerolineae bacterium]|nr:rhomboid family intramembrane serine protease [Anaerolineae bacterium]MDW8172968.1 rhomboid family intramembrane serine protease [Anaerolineae bacterium]